MMITHAARSPDRQRGDGGRLIDVHGHSAVEPGFVDGPRDRAWCNNEREPVPLGGESLVRGAHRLDYTAIDGVGAAQIHDEVRAALDRGFQMGARGLRGGEVVASDQRHHIDSLFGVRFDRACHLELPASGGWLGAPGFVPPEATGA